MKKGNMLKNSSTAVFQKLVEVIFSFLFRTVLIKILGNTYLGLSGLFTNIFSLLSLAELGIGSAVVYLMYEPLEKNDEKKLQSLLKIYSRFYNILGIFILIVGLILIPFLPYLIKEYNSLTINIVPIYILTLFNVVASYFLAYRRSLLEADQKAFINSANYSFYTTLGTILKILALIVSKNYIITLVITLIMTILSNISIYVKTNKMYSFLPIGKAESLDKRTKGELIKRVFASSIHQVGNIVLNGTDNIIISTLLGLIVVGKYSNYVLITSIIYSTFSLMFISITANVGNMKLTSTKEEALSAFNKLFLINNYLYFIACTVFGGMINKMITLWIGKEYIFSYWVVILITISLYVQGMRNVIVTFINSSGLNYNTRYKSIFEIVLNLVISIVLCKYIGISGVILGTILSYTLVSVWYEPYVLFKNWFKTGLRNYYLKYMFCFVLMLIQMLILNYIGNLIVCKNILIFILLGIGEFVLSNLIFVIVFGKSEEFKYFLTILKQYLNKFLRRSKSYE